jgi:hypothetical protein
MDPQTSISIAQQSLRMKLFSSKTLCSGLMALALVACTKNVTNNVPGPTISTPYQQSGPSSGIDSSSGGGVINGGGGKGVLCTKNGKQTLEVLDLYEARVLYHEDLLDLSNSEESAKDKLAGLLAKHFWTPMNGTLEESIRRMRTETIDKFFENVHYIDEGKRLKLSNDSYEPVLENGCEPVQIAMYYDDTILLVDHELWDKLNVTNKMALIAHEVLYFTERQAGSTNSISTRKLVGRMLSTTGLLPMYSGAPVSEDKLVQCSLSQSDIDLGNIYFYEGREDGVQGVHALFFGLGKQDSFLRSHSFFRNYSLLDIAQAWGNGYTGLQTDTFPAHESVVISINKGWNEHWEIEGSLSLTKGEWGGDLQGRYKINCHLPSSFENLQEYAGGYGLYERISDSDDKLQIEGSGKIVITQTRLIPNTSIDCRYKQVGVVKNPIENPYKLKTLGDDRIDYLITSIEQDNDFGHGERACFDFVENENKRIAQNGGSGGSENLSEFRKVESFTKLK